MVKRRILEPKSVLDEAQLLTFLSKHGIKEKHAAKLWRTIVQECPVTDLAAIPYAELDLPKAMAELIPRHFRVLTSEVLSQQTSGDGTTTKLVVRLQDGHEVESVIMRHSAQRSTLCVSSQVGCQMGCTFCATGTMGIIGNLHGGEILEQLMHANLLQLSIGGGRIRNVVFMGMGEPLNNYHAVLSAVHGMVDVKRFGLRKSHVTVSTVGVLPYMRKLIADAPWVNLALSLHAPTQDLRLQVKKQQL
jgi:sorting nexin-8